MKITVAKSSGFCFGVKRALDIAIKSKNANKTVEMLRNIVHNEDVVKEISRAGIKKINKLTNGKNKTLIISAHGISKKIIEKALRLGYEVIDATCPMVKEIHRTAINAERKGYTVVVIGDTKHDEVQGIIGQLKKKATVVDNINHIPLKTIKKVNKAAVVVQSTQNLAQTLRIVRILRKYIPELKFYNTICQPTRTKQKEIKQLSLENNVIIIIGSRMSANSKRLYEISKSINKRSYLIQSKNQIKKSWFKNIKKVGIMASASTPEKTTNDIVEYIKKLS